MSPRRKRIEGMTRTEAAQYLSISANRIDQLARENRLDWDETPFGRLYTRESLDKYDHYRKTRKDARWKALEHFRE